MASPVVVSAVEATPEDVSIIQMQSVKGEAIERSATLVAVTGATGIRAASGNIDSENLGYAPNAKYSFQDLKFDPEKLSKTNSARQIQFKIYGKHNIAASTDNWKINLQIDERIAKHVIGIEVEPKRLTEANPRPIRRALTRKSDTIGRMTNIWEVNYIRSENGVFAGGETTDTQTAHNGIIYLDKPLNKILEEIGDENLTNERLFYRIYLTSVQDKGAIVPGIASTGFFTINGLDIQIETIESSGNEKWFKHAAVEGRYVRSDKFKNPGGAINQNGAIVVDHKISKNTNFAYISAKNKPWTLEYGVDPRLVKYIGGIELYYMDAADYVNPDYSLKNKANRKVRDLSIVRTAGHKKYGYGDITENQFTQIVDVHGGRPEPITIRYVYKLNKPINEILEELRREAGVEEGEAFGKDFIFSAWITDKTKDALITNTYGTGYYRIQDIDGDGTVTVKEQKDNEKYIPEFDQINKNYGEATTEEEIKGALKEESVPENTEVTVKNPENLPDGMTEGTFEIEVTVEYPDGTSEDTTVQVVVTDNRTDAEKYTPEFDQIEKNYGEATTEEEIKGALKEESVPENTEVTVKNPESLPDGMTEGTFEIEVTVEYPDGTSEDTTVQVVVTDNFLVVTKNPPKQIDGQRVAENTNVITANLTFTVEGVHDEGLNSGLSIDENGNLTGTPKLNWGDKNSDTYEEQTVVLHAIATAESGSKKPVTISVVVQRDTDGDGEPDITDTDDDGDGFTDIEEEEKGTDPKDPDSVPQVDPKPVKPDQKQDPEISQNKVVNNVVNNSYKKPISNAPKTGDFGNGTGYTGLAALAAGLMLLLGIKKKRKEEDGEE